MDFADIQKMRFKDKCNIIKAVSLEYNRALLYMNNQNTKELNYVRETSANNNNNNLFRKEQINLVTLVDATLRILKYEEMQIILNDFLKPKKAIWWQDFYSKSNYYLKKGIALNYFTFYLLA